MRFYRGIAVSAERATEVVHELRKTGLTLNGRRWQTEHYKADLALIEKPDLCTKDTHPKGKGIAAVCACGTLEGASYYAWQHNRNKDNDTPIIIEFDAEADQVAVDGKDFLFPLLQPRDPVRAREGIRSVFGEKGLFYVEKAWAKSEPDARIAIGHIMVHDPAVVSAHYSNILNIAGRVQTRFQNAFTISLPISPLMIADVRIPSEPWLPGRVDLDLESLLRVV